MHILIDVDDTLSDTITHFEARLGPAADLGASSLAEMFPGVDFRPLFEDDEFHMAIPAVPGALEGVRAIAERGHSFRYVTSRPSFMEAVTARWLDELGFPQAPLDCVGREAKKVLLRQAKYDLLIDDQIRYLSEARGRGLRVLALAYPWNQGWEGPRCANWAELMRAL